MAVIRDNSDKATIQDLYDHWQEGDYIPGSGIPIPNPKTEPSNASGERGKITTVNNKMLQEQLAQQRAMQDQLRQERLSGLENTYNQLLSGVASSYDTLKKTRQDNYNYSSGVVNNNSDEALRQAYISKMMQQRNLNQELSAMGRSGGASESTMLKLANAYGSQRGQTERQRSDQLASLLNERNAGNAQDTLWYNNMVNQYKSQYSASRDAILNDAISALGNYGMQAGSDQYYNQRLAELQNTKNANQLQSQL